MHSRDNTLVFEDIIFNINFGISEIEDQILASILFSTFEQIEQIEDFESLDEFLPAILEYLSEKDYFSKSTSESQDDFLNEEVNRIMKILEESTLKKNLDLVRSYKKGTDVIAFFDVDNDWHPAKIVSFDLETKKAIVQFSEGALSSIKKELDFQQYSLDPNSLDNIEQGKIENKIGRCYFCKREMKLSRHHLYPKEMHLKYIKKSFTRDYLMSNTLSICRPCHSAVHRAESNEMLASTYNTPESLATHPKIIKFVRFICSR